MKFEAYRVKLGTVCVLKCLSYVFILYQLFLLLMYYVVWVGSTKAIWLSFWKIIKWKKANKNRSLWKNKLLENASSNSNILCLIVFRRGDPVPKFHYEVRSYSKVVVCSDLTDSELEFTCVQGINLNVSKDAHNYCRYVFHFTMDHIFNKWDV